MTKARTHKCRFCGRLIWFHDYFGQWDAEGPNCDRCSRSPDGKHAPIASMQDYVTTTS